jgi:hypothetical protein
MNNKFNGLLLITASLLISTSLISNTLASEDMGSTEPIEPIEPIEATESTVGCWGTFKVVLKKMVPCLQVTADVAVDIADEFVDDKDTIDKVDDIIDKVDDIVDNIESEEDYDNIDELTPLESKKSHKKKRWFESFRVFRWMKNH